MLLSPKLQKLLVDSLVVPQSVIFFETGPFVNRNNAEFTNVSCCTSLLMCSTHFTLSYRVLFIPLPTSNNFFQLVCSEITRKSAWWIQFWSPRCCLLLWHLEVIKI